MNIHSIKSLVKSAILRWKLRKQCEFYRKHMVVLRVGDWVCTEDGTPIGLFDGLNIQHSGYTDGS